MSNSFTDCRIGSFTVQTYVLVPVALACLLLLFVGGPGPDSLRSWRFLWGAGHLVGFAVWTCLYVNWRKPAGFLRLLSEVLLLTLLIGGLTEVLQAGIGRQASWQDLGNDLVGSLLGLLLMSRARRQLSRPWRMRLQLPLLLVTLWVLWPILQVVWDDLVAWRQFPLLSGFETSLEASRWSGSAARQVSDTYAFEGRSALHVMLTTQRYSGIGLKDFPADWSEYRAIQVQVYNPDPEPLTLHFRIHDQRHRDFDNAYSDRFNTSFDLHQGWNLLQVTLDKVAGAPRWRRLDLTRVAGLVLFVGKLERPRSIYLDDVRLLP